jgi:hypothetical protein
VIVADISHESLNYGQKEYRCEKINLLAFEDSIDFAPMHGAPYAEKVDRGEIQYRLENVDIVYGTMHQQRYHKKENND